MSARRVAVRILAMACALAAAAPSCAGDGGPGAGGDADTDADADADAGAQIGPLALGVRLTDIHVNQGVQSTIVADGAWNAVPKRLWEQFLRVSIDRLFW